ncbi:MAG: hypothetical protein WBA53_00545 [Burkholderiaceae bacterium]
MPMYVREPVPAGVVAALVVLDVIRKARECDPRLDVRIVLGTAFGVGPLAAECENLKRLFEG